MATEAASLDPSLRPIDPALRIGSVRLGVGDLERSLDFYQRALGLQLISSDRDGAALGTEHDAHPALLLEPLQHPAQASPHSTGLFHVAWLHPSRSALAATVERVVGARWPIHGASDHGVSEALYLTDPDGLGVEIYADRPREQWKRGRDHAVELVTLPLDVDDLLAQAPPAPSAAVAPGTTIGHVHLKVSDVPRAAGFYRDTLGFEEQATMPSAAFLSAGGYHHHVGVNSWQSRGAQAPSEDAPGVRLIAFELHDSGALAALQQRLARTSEPPAAAQRPGQLRVSDPDGNRLMFSAPAPA
jgi:catechol 2,3-dioxygenase